MAGEKIAGDMSQMEDSSKKELLVPNVKGKVKWFNVELGYGFINRDDTNEDVFVHHTAIIKYNTRHQLSSLADGELVEFDVVQGKKGKEAANVCGPNGEHVKGSRYASNLYAGRFRSRRGSNLVGGGRRFYGRRVNRDDHSAKNSQSEDVKQGEIIKADPKKELIGLKKHPRIRRNMAEVGRGGEKGGLKRSSSLPSDLGRYAGGNIHRRRRRGPRGPDGRPFFRATFSEMKRRGPRTNEKETPFEKGKKLDDVETQHESEKEGRGEGESKGSFKESKSIGRRLVSEGKSEKSGELTLNEKSDKSQKPSHKRRPGRRERAKKNSEVAGEKTENSQSAPEDDRPKLKDVSGDGNNGRPYRRGKWRRNKKQGGSRRSSSTEPSAQTPSTREGEEAKSEKEKRHGANGDGAKIDCGAGGGKGAQIATGQELVTA